MKIPVLLYDVCTQDAQQAKAVLVTFKTREAAHQVQQLLADLTKRQLSTLGPRVELLVEQRAADVEAASIQEAESSAHELDKSVLSTRLRTVAVP